MAAPAVVGHSPFAALRHRNFRLFWTGQTISQVGTWMQGLAQGWLVLQLTNSAFWVALVSFLGSLPVLVVSLPAGVFVDRANKRRLVAICQALMLAEAALLTALTALHVVRAWQVAVLAAFMGLFSAVEIPARQSMIVELVAREDLTNAIALNSSAFNAARIFGPAVAGFLVAHVGLAVCFALNALSYVAVLVGLRLMELPPREIPPAQSHPWEQLKDGLRYVRGEPRVRALVTCTGMLSLFGFPYLVLLPVFARDVLHRGADGLGLMSAVVGLGALASAFGLAAFGPRLGRGRLVTRSSMAFGLAVAAFAAARWYGLALLTLAISGFLMVLYNAATNTLLQTLAPDAMRGRVMALWSTVFVGFAPIGALAVGWLAERVGASTAVAAGGLLATLAAFVIWRRTPALGAMR